MEPISRSPKPRNWTRKQINRELRRAGFRQVDISESTGRSQSLVSEVIGGTAISMPVASDVSARLGKHPWEIWPRLYAPPSEEPTTEPTGAPDAIATAC